MLGKLDLRAVKTVAFEKWLKTLTTAKFGAPKPLAGGTREKIVTVQAGRFGKSDVGRWWRR